MKFRLLFLFIFSVVGCSETIKNVVTSDAGENATINNEKTNDMNPFYALERPHLNQLYHHFMHEDATDLKSEELSIDNVSAAAPLASTDLLAQNETTSAVCDQDLTSCESENMCTFTEKKGCFQIPHSDQNSFTYDIRLDSEHSIIELKMTLTASQKPSKEKATVKITEKNFTMATWNVVAHESMDVKRYRSRFSRLRIDIEVPEGWTDAVLTFEYREIEFDMEVYTFHGDVGEITPDIEDGQYVPNRVTIYKLTPNLYNDSSVMLTLWYLDINDTIGEYLLIGAGKEPFESKGMFITGEKKSPKKYYIPSDDVYIVFVARSSDRKSSGFKITWRRNGTRITNEVTDEGIPDLVLQSMPICFYGLDKSLIKEFHGQGNGTDRLLKFRKKFAEIANQYVHDKGHYLPAPISEDSVKIVRVSAVLPPNKYNPSGALYVMVTISKRFDNSMAVFRWFQLEEIINRFDAYDTETNHALLHTKVGKCPPEVDYTSWKISVYVLVPLCCFLFLLIWGWRHSAVLKSRRLKSSGKKYRSDELGICRHQELYPVATENEYVLHPKTVPKVRLTTDEGRNFSMDIGRNYSQVLSDEDSDIEIFNKLWKKARRRSEIPESMKSSASGDSNKTQTPTFETVREGDRSWLWQKNANIANMMNTMPTPKTEHVYDSLESTMNADHFEPDYDTKL